GIDSGDRSPGGGATRAPRGLGSLLQGAAFRGNKTTGAEVRFREPLVLVQRRDLLPLHDPAVRAAEDPGDQLRAYDLRRAGHQRPILRRGDPGHLRRAVSAVAQGAPASRRPGAGGAVSAPAPGHSPGSLWLAPGE